MGERLTDEQIAEIRARHAAVPDGDWRTFRDGDPLACNDNNVLIETDDEEWPGVLLSMNSYFSPCEPTLEFVAHSKRDVDSLLSEVFALKAEVASLRQVSAELCEDCGWAMRFPGEECRNCECARLEVENDALQREAAQ